MLIDALRARSLPSCKPDKSLCGLPTRFPHCVLIKSLWEDLPFLAPLRSRGRTESSSLSSTTTPSGASWVADRVFVRQPPLRLRLHEGHLLAAHLGRSLQRRLVLRLASFTRRFLTPRFAACGPSSDVVRSPFFNAYLFLAALPYSPWVLLLGQTDVFPVCGRPRLQPSFPVRPLFPV